MQMQGDGGAHFVFDFLAGVSDCDAAWQVGRIGAIACGSFFDDDEKSVHQSPLISRSGDGAKRSQPFQSHRLGLRQPGVAREGLKSAGEVGARFVIAAKDGETLGDLLVDVAVLLAQHVELALQLLLEPQRFLDTAQRAQRASLGPERDADQRRIALRAAAGGVMADLIQSIRAAFPRELLAKPNWVTWQFERRDGKLTKVPYSGAHNAKSTDPNTWAAFDKAADGYGEFDRSGVGYVFDGDGVIGVDLDHAREDGAFKPWAQEIITRLHSYTEVSPSGNGVHIYLRGQLPGERHKRAMPDGSAIEFYSSKRFFTVTGDYLDETPRAVQERQDALATLYAELFPTYTQAGRTTPCAACGRIRRRTADEGTQREKRRRFHRAL
jgi:hypothetical protein